MLKQENSWIKELDIIKALAIIIIVLSHLHYFINLGNYNLLFLSISSYLAALGLSLFFFVSGFVLYYTYDHISLKNLGNFYLKRAVRIYPLFWLAIIVFLGLFFINYGNVNVWGKELLINILGLQAIFFTDNQDVMLYWFVGVLLIYYFIYPIIIYPKNLGKKILLSLVLYLILLGFRLKFNLISANFFIYYWTFILGIIICSFVYGDNKNHFSNMISISKQKTKLVGIFLIIVFVIFTILYTIIPLINNSLFLKYGSFVFLSLLLVLPCLSIYIGVVILKKRLIDNSYKVLSRISFGTYAIYLFSLPTMSTLVFVLQNIFISQFFINCLVIVIGIPLVMLIGYQIQKTEHILRKFLRNYFLNFK